MKRNFLEFIKVIIIFMITPMVIYCGILLSIFFFFLLDIDQYLQYNFKISSKESLIEAFLENQSEFDRIAGEMKRIYESDNEYIILLRGRAEYREKGLESAIFKEIPISQLSIVDSEDIGLEITFGCAPAFCPDDYTYWGIYYSDSDLPRSWGGELESVSEDYYVCEAPGQFYYETEKIMDNWYYYQCWSR